MPIKQWYTEAKAFEKEEKKKASENFERAEFERLKRKFG